MRKEEGMNEREKQEERLWEKATAWANTHKVGTSQGILGQ